MTCRSSAILLSKRALRAAEKRLRAVEDTSDAHIPKRLACCFVAFFSSLINATLVERVFFVLCRKGFSPKGVRPLVLFWRGCPRELFVAINLSTNL